MFHFFWGLPHKKGVCILDIFYRINHFNSKWRVKYSVLFVAGAAALRPFDVSKHEVGRTTSDPAYSTPGRGVT